MEIVAEWLTAIGTVALSAVSAWVIIDTRQARKREQADRQWDEAQKIEMKPHQLSQGAGDGDMYVNSFGVTVLNHGRRSIKEVELKAFLPDGTTELATLFCPVIASEGQQTFPFAVPAYQWRLKIGMALVPRIYFADVAGQRWSKDVIGDAIPIKSV